MAVVYRKFNCLTEASGGNLRSIVSATSDGGDHTVVVVRPSNTDGEDAVLPPARLRGFDECREAPSALRLVSSEGGSRTLVLTLSGLFLVRGAIHGSALSLTGLTSNAVRVCPAAFAVSPPIDAKWHPLSPSHFVVLSRDGIRIFDADGPGDCAAPTDEWRFPAAVASGALPSGGGPLVEALASSSDSSGSGSGGVGAAVLAQVAHSARELGLDGGFRPVAFDFGGMRGWEALSIIIACQSGALYALCPVLPTGCRLPAADWLALLEESRSALRDISARKNATAASQAAAAAAGDAAAQQEIVDREERRRALQASVDWLLKCFVDLDAPAGSDAPSTSAGPAAASAAGLSAAAAAAAAGSEWKAYQPAFSAAAAAAAAGVFGGADAGGAAAGRSAGGIAGLPSLSRRYAGAGSSSSTSAGAPSVGLSGDGYGFEFALPGPLPAEIVRSGLLSGSGSGTGTAALLWAPALQGPLLTEPDIRFGGRAGEAAEALAHGLPLSEALMACAPACDVRCLPAAASEFPAAAMLFADGGLVLVASNTPIAPAWGVASWPAPSLGPVIAAAAVAAEEEQQQAEAQALHQHGYGHGHGHGHGHGEGQVEQLDGIDEAAGDAADGHDGDGAGAARRRGGGEWGGDADADAAAEPSAGALVPAAPAPRARPAAFGLPRGSRSASASVAKSSSAASASAPRSASRGVPRPSPSPYRVAASASAGSGASTTVLHAGAPAPVWLALDAVSLELGHPLQVAQQAAGAGGGAYPGSREGAGVGIDSSAVRALAGVAPGHAVDVIAAPWLLPVDAGAGAAPDRADSVIVIARRGAFAVRFGGLLQARSLLRSINDAARSGSISGIADLAASARAGGQTVVVDLLRANDADVVGACLQVNTAPAVASGADAAAGDADNGGGGSSAAVGGMASSLVTSGGTALRLWLVPTGTALEAPAVLRRSGIHSFAAPDASPAASGAAGAALAGDGAAPFDALLPGRLRSVSSLAVAQALLLRQLAVEGSSGRIGAIAGNDADDGTGDASLSGPWARQLGFARSRLQRLAADPGGRSFRAIYESELAPILRRRIELPSATDGAGRWASAELPRGLDRGTVAALAALAHAANAAGDHAAALRAARERIVGRARELAKVAEYEHSAAEAASAALQRVWEASAAHATRAEALSRRLDESLTRGFSLLSALTEAGDSMGGSSGPGGLAGGIALSPAEREYQAQLQALLERLTAMRALVNRLAGQSDGLRTALAQTAATSTAETTAAGSAAASALLPPASPAPRSAALPSTPGASASASASASTPQAGQLMRSALESRRTASSGLTGGGGMLSGLKQSARLRGSPSVGGSPGTAAGAGGQAPAASAAAAGFASPSSQPLRSTGALGPGAAGAVVATGGVTGLAAVPPAALVALNRQAADVEAAVLAAQRSIAESSARLRTLRMEAERRGLEA